MARILVVDDSAVDRQVIINSLSPKGHSLIEAVDGEEGESKAVSLKPDLIILDVVMPKKNGFEVCRSLKQNPITASIPAASRSGRAPPARRARAGWRRNPAAARRPAGGWRLAGRALGRVRSSVGLALRIVQQVSSKRRLAGPGPA